MDEDFIHAIYMGVVITVAIFTAGLIVGVLLHAGLAICPPAL